MFAEAAAPRRAAEGLVVSKRGNLSPVKPPPELSLDGPFSSHNLESLDGFIVLYLGVSPPCKDPASSGHSTMNP